MKRLHIIAIITLISAATGCATVDPSENWEVVKHNTIERLNKTLIWEKTNEDREQIDKLVDTMLADGLTRPEAMQIILLKNRDLQARFEDVGISTAEYVQASQLTNPILVGGALFPQYHSTYELDGTLYGFLSDLWLLPARKRYSRLAMEAQIFSVSEAVIQTAFEGVVAFDNVLYRQTKLELAEEQSAKSKQIEKRIKVRYAAGLVDEYEVYQATVDAGKQEIAVAEAKRNLTRAKAYFDRLLCLDPQRELSYVITDSLYTFEVKEWNLKEAYKFAYDNRLDIKRARIRVEQARKAIDYQNSAVWDNVQVGVSEAAEVDGEHQIGPAFAGQLPLFDQNRGRIARACYLYRKAVKTFEQLEARVRTEVTDLVAEIEYRKAQVDQMENTILPKKKRQIEDARNDAELMHERWLQMLKAEQEYLELKGEYLDALWQLRRADSQLQHVMVGGGVEETFGEPPGLLERERARTLLPQLVQPVP